MRINTSLVNESIGLGDVIKKATTTIGIKPCSACQKRAEKLNKLLTLTPSIDIPEGFSEIKVSGCAALLEHKKTGSWVVFKLKEGILEEPRSFCNCQILPYKDLAWRYFQEQSQCR